MFFFFRIFLSFFYISIPTVGFPTVSLWGNLRSSSHFVESDSVCLLGLYMYLCFVTNHVILFQDFFFFFFYISIPTVGFPSVSLWGNLRSSSHFVESELVC